MNARKILAFAIGPIGNAALGLLTLPVITWLFSADDVGRISMLNVAVSFCVLFFSLGLDQAYVREYHRESDRGQLLKNVAFPGLLMIVVISTVFLLFPGSLSVLLFEQKDTAISWLVMLILLASFINRFLSLILRMQEKGMAFSLSQLMPKLMTLIVIGLCYALFTQHTLMQLVVANAVGFIAVSLMLMWSSRTDWIAMLYSSLDYGKLKAMLKFGYPLILGGLAFWGLTTIDRMFVRAYSGFEQLAIFSVAVSFAGVMNILQSVFSTIWAPMVYKLAESDEGGEQQMINKVSRCMGIAVVCLFSLGGLFSWLVDYVLPVKYLNVKYIFVASLGFPLLFTLSETTAIGIGLSRKTAYTMLASLIALIINVLANVLLVPSFGAGGAAVSTCLAFWAFLILRTEFSIISWKTMPRFEMYFFTFLCLAGASVSALAGERMKYELLVYWATLLVVVLLRNLQFLKSLAKR
ncbi:oligosaccharide flippase family protein [Serratia nevei]|uniref:lipopolysaccharide biosynthesis protein n=1 Tax=Serratia TaxID=613 RepID=UPI00066A72D8|nr:oligosaccharide flippase family protein [Serratia marcescens]BEN39128.1 polysaccharide biosynthesis protein [Serratia marcescens]